MNNGDIDMVRGTSDADLEMAELEAAGDMFHNGVCALCEDVLDPLAPRWAHTEWPRRGINGPRCTAEEWAIALGPFDASLRFHHSCMREAGMGDLIRS